MSKPFIERLSLDKANLKYIHENKQEASGLSVFKSSFLNKLGDNVKANLLMLAFCIPIIVWAFISQLDQVTFDSTIPYSGNIGIGYPVVNDAHIVGAISDFTLAMKRALYMMPLIIVGAVGLAGLFNVIKYYCWGFKIKVIKTFFRGIKNSYVSFVWVGMMLAVCFVLISFVLNIFKVHVEVALGWKIAAYGGTVLFCSVVLLLSVFITTQATVFNLTLMEILKNSLHLGMRFLLQNVLILVVGLVSMALPLLTFNSYVQIAAYVLFFLLGFSWTATVWTIYTHSIYNMMYTPEESGSGKNKTSKSAPKPTNSVPKPADQKAKQQTAIVDAVASGEDKDSKSTTSGMGQVNKQGKQHYKNPKKNKKH